MLLIFTVSLGSVLFLVFLHTLNEVVDSQMGSDESK